MPEDAPKSEMEATRSYGARIVTYNRLRKAVKLSPRPS